MIVVTTKLHKVIPLVRADACAALRHTLLVIRFYFIRSSLSMGCPTDFTARILLAHFKQRMLLHGIEGPISQRH